MAEQWITVKQYAETHGITIQAVYQQINRKQNKDFISQHSKKMNGMKYLDEEAVAYLESKRESSPTVILQSDDKERIEQLEQENKMLMLKIVELQSTIITKSERIEQLQEANLLLLEQKQEKQETQPRSFWQKLFGKNE